MYKVLGSTGEALHGGSGAWNLPKGKRPGVWMPKIEDPRCCNRGYHLVELHSLAEWLRHDCTIYVAEGRGSSDSDNSGKTAFAQARLIRRLHISERDLRLFAADCAEHVLPLFETKYPKDDRPRKAIAAARALARGEITAATATATATAAWSARAAAAWSARAVADAAWSARAAADAADAATARKQEREWQGAKLAEYLGEAVD
jgi:hypothetical protein